VYAIIREVNSGSLDEFRLIFSRTSPSLEQMGICKKSINPAIEKHCRDATELIRQVAITESPAEKLAILTEVLFRLNQFEE
jgi:hypothetical protein